MRKITLQENRKLCLALMTAKGRGVNLTSACWQVAGVIFHWAEQGKSTIAVADLKRLLNLSGAVVRRALSRLHDCRVVILSGSASQLQFVINWTLLDDVASEVDRGLVDYWRKRGAEEDRADPDAP
ncbi:hypothetical protein ACCT04_14645 [Rhizobium ruizarguesonis]